YFVQAKKQLAGQDTELMEMGSEGVPTIFEFLEDHLPEGGVLGFDGRVVNTADGRRFERLAEEGHGSLSIGHDLAGEIWKDRPPLLAPQIWVLEERYSGETAVSKLSRLRAAMKEQKATVHLLSSLDDIAWLLNIRKQSEDGNLLPL